MVDQNNDEFLTPEEAGALVKKTRRTLERWADEGKIIKYRQGSRIFFKRGELLKMMEIQPAEPKSPDE